MNYGHIRVDGDKQTVENLRFEFNCFCEHESIKLDDWNRGNNQRH